MRVRVIISEEMTMSLQPIAPGVPYNASVAGYNVLGYGKTITGYGYIQELGEGHSNCEVIHHLFIHVIVRSSTISSSMLPRHCRVLLELWVEVIHHLFIHVIVRSSHHLLFIHVIVRSSHHLFMLL